jgi:FKBP-type peptidyl-prolyl cis-trans isomerase FkpA
MYKNLSIFLIIFVFCATGNAIEIVKGDHKMVDKIKELTIENLQEGEGRAAEKGLSVIVHYTGWIYDQSQGDGRGKKFDSSLDRREPFTFVLGVGQVIKGWDEGVKDMKVGGKRVIIIPSDMAYGARGAGDVIPPNTDLIFEVELLGLQ